MGIDPEKTKTLIQKDTCTPKFIAALFTIAKIRKQPKGPPTDEWIKKVWYKYIHNGIYICMYTHTHTQTHTMNIT